MNRSRAFPHTLNIIPLILGFALAWICYLGKPALADYEPPDHPPPKGGTTSSG